MLFKNRKLTPADFLMEKCIMEHRNAGLEEYKELCEKMWETINRTHTVVNVFRNHKGPALQEMGKAMWKDIFGE